MRIPVWREVSLQTWQGLSICKAFNGVVEQSKRVILKEGVFVFYRRVA